MVKKVPPSTSVTPAHCVLGESNAPHQNTEGGGHEATSGAPPCNTAPANYIDSDSGTHILRSGVDSLYVSYQGSVREEVADHLDYLKTLAQSDDPRDQAKAVYEVAGHRFEVRGKGSGKFPYVLVDNWFYVQVSRSTTTHLPFAKIQINSELLTRSGVEPALEAAYQVARALGVVDFEIKINRIDLCVDFVTDTNVEGIDRTHWITRAKQYRDYWDGDTYTGLTFGLGGDIACRLYNKTVEIEGKEREYLKQLWLSAGWNGTDTAWRLEFEIKRPLLREFGLFEERDVLDNLDSLWEYATGPWLRLGVPTSGVNKSRWSTHAMWDCLRKVRSCLDRGEPLSRVAKARLPSKERMYVQGLAPLTTYMAAEGLDDPHEAFRLLLSEAERFHQENGVELLDYLARKVGEKARRYNVLRAPERLKVAKRAYQQAKEGK